MQPRRALLLFAILIGLAAIVASVSRPRETATRPSPAAPRADRGPTARPAPSRPEVAQLRFSPGGRPRTERLAAGRPAVVTVEVPKAGEVALEGLGVVEPADPLTPARFDLLESRAGRFPVRFTPAGRGAAVTLGTLVVAGR